MKNGIFIRRYLPFSRSSGVFPDLKKIKSRPPVTISDKEDAYTYWYLEAERVD